MASYPGMKPMLNFTNIPSRAELLQPRRRRKVVTPKIPRVKSICLSQEEVVPDMKWVSPQFDDYPRTLTKAVQPRHLGSLPFTGVGKRKPKNKLTVIHPCLSSADTRGRRGGGIAKRASVRAKKPSNVVLVRQPLQKVDENSVDSSSESDWDFVSAPPSNQRVAAVSQRLTRTSRSDVLPTKQAVPCSHIPTCTSSMESSIQMQLRQDFNDNDSNSGGFSQESTQVTGCGSEFACIQPKSSVKESWFQSHCSSQSSFVPTTTVTRCNEKISKVVDCSENGLSRARHRKNVHSGNCGNSSPAEHKLSGGSSQNMDQTSHHLQLTDQTQQSSDCPNSRLCNYPLNSEQNVIEHCHSMSQRLGESSHLCSGPPNSKRTSSHMISASTKAPSGAGFTRYSTSTAKKNTSSSRTCLQPKQQEICDLNQMVSTMNIDDKNSCSLMGVKFNQNPDVNATFNFADFHPKSASTPCTKRVTRHGIVCHTPLTISSTPSTSIAFHGTEDDGHNAANGSSGQSEDVTVWAPETPSHLMVSLQRGKERCKRHLCTGDLCVVDDTLG